VIAVPHGTGPPPITAGNEKKGPLSPAQAPAGLTPDREASAGASPGGPEQRRRLCPQPWHLTTAELERAKRELKANLGLLNPDSPAHVPIQTHMQAIDTELSQRASSQHASGKQCDGN
jgi:hypothetical protein